MASRIVSSSPSLHGSPGDNASAVVHVGVIVVVASRVIGATKHGWQTELMFYGRTKVRFIISNNMLPVLSIA